MAKQPINKYNGSEYKNQVLQGTIAEGIGTVDAEPVNEVVPTPTAIITENTPMKRNYDIIVQVVNTSNHVLPKYETKNSAGLDLRANLESPIVLPAHGRMMIHTGQYWAIPEGYECQIRPRSGLALKHGITVLNTPGTIDADYRGEICVILMNHSNENYVINPGDKIAQAVFHKYERIEWEEVDTLDATERGEGGFGHTGK